MMYNSFGEWFYSTIITIPGILLGLSFHEYAHAIVAYRCGDPTPKNQGRITLNPLYHIHWIGFISLLLFHFGWGKPVEINSSYFKGNKRTALFMVSIAGVIMNFVIAIFFTVVLKILTIIGITYGDYLVLWNIIVATIRINIALIFFNLLPIPPLDGFNAISSIIDFHKSKFYYYAINYGQWVLLLLVLTGALNGVLSFFINNVMGLLLSAFKI